MQISKQILKNSEKLNSIIKDYKLLEENIFIGRISDIALENKNLVISKLQAILDDDKTGIHLKYLIIKLTGILKYQKFIPILTKLLVKEDKDRMIGEILNSLSNIINIESYKTVTAFFSEPKNKIHLPKFNTYLKVFYGKSPLIYHFDVFYRERGDVNNIDISSKYLITHLEQTYVKNILPAIFSKYDNISLEALKILEKRPGTLFYKNIDELFKSRYKQCSQIYFRQMTRALLENSIISPHKKKLYIKLKNYLNELQGDKKSYFIMLLLKLDTKKILSQAVSIYNQLPIEDKLSFLNNLEPALYPIYGNFIRDLLIKEVNEDILIKVISIIMLNKEFDFLFEIAEKQRGVKREYFISMIIETGTGGLSHYMKSFLSLSESNTIIIFAIGYIMNDSPDTYYNEIANLLLSGVALEIKQRVLRNIKKFNDENTVKIINSILENKTVLKKLEKDFLLLIIVLQERELFDGKLLEFILNKVLLMMEEAEPEQIVNFIYFFDSFEVKNNAHKKLIIDELKMIQNTLLKSSKNDNLVNMIYKLIKKTNS